LDRAGFLQAQSQTSPIKDSRVVGVQVGEQGFDGIEPLQAAPSGFFNCFLGFLLAHRIPHAECLARLIEAVTLN